MAHSPDDALQQITKERWRRLEYLIHAARERQPADRAAFLKDACSGDETLYAELQSLLACEGNEHPLLESSPWPAAGLFASEPSQTRRCLASLDIGSQIDRFRITGWLGNGGMSEVYSAKDTMLGREVALKFLALKAELDEAVEQVTREARAVSALNHPNIVTVHEVIHHGETPVIVMELIEGVALRAMCGTPQPLDWIVHVGRQTAEALAAAHAHGIVHSDIKPENIIVRPDGYVKVLDFGLARPVTAEALRSNDSLHGGTLRYMSPGRVRGKPASVSGDIFSLGLVLYELATGKRAFPSDSPVGAVYAMLTHEPAKEPLDRSVPPRLRSLILSMLAKDSAARPSAQEVATILRNDILPAEKPAVWRRPMVALAIGASLLLLTAAIAAYLFADKDSPQFADLSIQPLTSQAGWEASPALSPDGRSVAFTWTEKLDGIRQIYVKRLNGTEPVRLTNSQTEGNIGPLAWSPDGRRIAFERSYGKAGAIYSISGTGGGEKKLLDLPVASLSSGIDWSPDANRLVFSEAIPGSERLAVYLLNLRTRQKRQLTFPPREDWGDWDPKFSPDGSTVAFKRVAGFWTDDIFLVSASGGASRRLTANGRGIWGHAWVADGRSLVVSCQRGSILFGLWRFPLAPYAEPERITQGGLDAITPGTGRKTSRISWVNQLWDLNIYRSALSGMGVPARLIASTVRDQGAAYSRDGRIAFISDRSGSREIWMASADGSNQVQVTHFDGASLGHLQWSPDAAHLSFDVQSHGRYAVFVLDREPSRTHYAAPRRLISEMPAGVSSWSADGHFVYFASEKTGRWEIWKQPAISGQITQVTHNGGYVSHESADGRWLYYSKAGKEGIWRKPGPNYRSVRQPATAEELVIGPPYKAQFEGWAVTPNEIVFIDAAKSNQPAAIRAYKISSKHIRTILRLREIFSDRADIGVSVSPDLHWLLYSQLDRSGSNIMVAENHR